MFVILNTISRRSVNIRRFFWKMLLKRYKYFGKHSLANVFLNIFTEESVSLKESLYPSEEEVLLHFANIFPLMLERYWDHREIYPILFTWFLCHFVSLFNKLNKIYEACQLRDTLYTYKVNRITSKKPI